MLVLLCSTTPQCIFPADYRVEWSHASVGQGIARQLHQHIAAACRGARLLRPVRCRRQRQRGLVEPVQTHSLEPILLAPACREHGRPAAHVHVHVLAGRAARRLLHVCCTPARRRGTGGACAPPGTARARR